MVVHYIPYSLVALIVSALPSSGSLVTDYAPQTNVPCPAEPLIREFTPQNQSLHPLEAQYVEKRIQKANQSWHDWLGDGSKLGYNLSQFDGSNGTVALPKIGIALSGGGHRAAQYGAGVLSALDARNDSATSAGTGGLLQVSTYLSGLSGGSWLTGSLYFNDWPTVKDMVFGNGGNLSGWLLDLSLVTPAGTDLFDQENQWFFGSILYSVIAKANLGVDTSLTDPWARMISYHFLNYTSRDNFFTNDTGHGAGQLWSRIPEIPSFQEGLPPFPLIMADSRPGNDNATTVLPPEPTVYEITPAEFGSWDPGLSAMMNISFIGTHLNNGTPPNSTGCVTGFDEAGFMMGTSASLFNQILDFAHNKLASFSSSDASGLLYVLSRQLSEVRTRADDVANWPNPFQGLKADTYEDSGTNWLSLIDGSSNQENVPLGPMFVRARGLDLVVAVDASADTSNNFPNGSSIVFSQQRISTILNTSHQSFPPIPSSTSQFISTGVNERATFFGCDPTNSSEYPLVVYFPNSPPVNGDDPVTNTGTFKLSYTNIHTTQFLDQAHTNTLSGFTPNATGPDSNFGICLQCAAIDRARYKVSPVVSRSDVCQACFTKYCFDPNNPPNGDEIVGRKLTFVDPDPQGLSKVEGFLGRAKIGLIVGLSLLVVALISAGLAVRWWKKRKEREYRRLSALAEDSDAPWKVYHERWGSTASIEMVPSPKRT